jgi:hypothetical protein
MRPRVPPRAPVGRGACEGKKGGAWRGRPRTPRESERCSCRLRCAAVGLRPHPRPEAVHGVRRACEAHARRRQRGPFHPWRGTCPDLAASLRRGGKRSVVRRNRFAPPIRRCARGCAWGCVRRRFAKCLKRVFLAWVVRVRNAAWDLFVPRGAPRVPQSPAELFRASRRVSPHSPNGLRRGVDGREVPQPRRLFGAERVALHRSPHPPFAVAPATARSPIEWIHFRINPISPTAPLRSPIRSRMGLGVGAIRMGLPIPSPKRLRRSRWRGIVWSPPFARWTPLKRTGPEQPDPLARPMVGFAPISGGTPQRATTATRRVTDGDGDTLW